MYSLKLNNGMYSLKLNNAYQCVALDNPSIGCQFLYSVICLKCVIWNIDSFIDNQPVWHSL